MRIGPVKDIESLFQMVAQFYPDAEENRETVLKIIEEVQWNTLMVELIYNGPHVKTTSKKILVNGRFVRRRQAALKSSSAKVP